MGSVVSKILPVDQAEKTAEALWNGESGIKVDGTDILQLPQNPIHMVKVYGSVAGLWSDNHDGESPGILSSDYWINNGAGVVQEGLTAAKDIFDAGFWGIKNWKLMLVLGGGAALLVLLLILYLR